MSKLIKINMGVDGDHNLSDFPVNIYTGTTTGDTTNWGFTGTPVLSYVELTTTPLEFWIDDEILSFGVRIEIDGCNTHDIFVESPRVDCDMCVYFEEIVPVECQMTVDFEEFDCEMTFNFEEI